MLKYFVEKILPSIVATVTAAYIVNHYIAVKPDTPPAAAASAAISDKAGDTDSEAKVRAGGISGKESAKAPDENVQPEKIPSEAAAAKPAEKRAASLPADTKKHQAPQREKAAKVRSMPAAPAQAASATDANDLARAAIDRLRNTTEASLEVEAVRSRSEGSRAQQDADRQSVAPSRLQEVTHAAPQAAESLPPAIQASTPTVETSRFDPAGAGEGTPFDQADRARLPVPPENIPQASRSFDLKASEPAPPTRAQTVADDMLSAAKAVVETVLPR
jgi:hypothetical protein